MAFALVLATVALAPQAFEDVYYISTSLRGVTAMQALDVDGDGDPDLVVAERDAVVWLRNEGDGPVGVFRPVGPNIYQSEISGMVWIDDDGDGDLDLIRTARNSVAPALARLENLGAGVFAAPQVLPTASTFAELPAVADINNDGELDLVLRDAQDGFVWREKLGPGAYGPSQAFSNTPSNARSYTLVDADLDGQLDFVVSDLNGRTWLHIGNGAGAFSVGVRLSHLPAGASQITVADLDLDGDDDLILSAPQLGRIWWLEQTGAGYAAVQPLIFPLSQVANLAYADVDGDGLGDIVCARFNGEETVWLRGLGNLNFAAAQTLVSDRGRMAHVAVSDFDGDGDLDTVATYHPDGGFVTSYLAFAMVDGAGQVEEDVDLTGGLGSIALTDMDGDGDQDFLSASALRSDFRWIENQGNGDPGFHRQIDDSVEGDVQVGAIDASPGSPLTLIVGDGGYSEFLARLRTFSVASSGTITERRLIYEVMADSGVSFACGDVNGDGHQDVIATYKRFIQPYRLQWFLGPHMNPGGTLDLSTVVMHWMGTMDVDSDGDDDVVFRTNVAGHRWIENTGGQFVGPPMLLGIGGGGDVSIGSFDGDGLDDMVIGRRFFENRGNGTFASPVTIEAGLTGNVYSGATDWDGDGDLDMIFGVGGAGLVTVAENVGGNAFAAPMVIQNTHMHATGIQVLDIDGDQDLDLYSGWQIQRNLRYFGSGICAPANPNPTGLSSFIFAEGSDAVASNDITLGANNLPVGAFGYFLTSRDTGFVPFVGGGQGTLCLGGSIGRYNRSAQEILQADAAGLVSLAIDLNDMPSPSGAVVALPGDTRYFQYWTRIVSGGVPSSNLSNALRVELR